MAKRKGSCRQQEEERGGQDKKASTGERKGKEGPKRGGNGGEKTEMRKRKGLGASFWGVKGGGKRSKEKLSMKKAQGRKVVKKTHRGGKKRATET